MSLTPKKKKIIFVKIFTKKFLNIKWMLRNLMWFSWLPAMTNGRHVTSTTTTIWFCFVATQYTWPWTLLGGTSELQVVVSFRIHDCVYGLVWKSMLCIVCVQHQCINERMNTYIYSDITTIPCAHNFQSKNSCEIELFFNKRRVSFSYVIHWISSVRGPWMC